MSHTRYSAPFLASLVLLSPAAAYAQTTPPRTPTAEPGRIQRNLELPAGERDAASAPLEWPENSTPASLPEGGSTFLLKDIRLSHATALSAEELRTLYAPYLGKHASLATLKTIAERITVHYRNEGYILTRAIVPPQRIKEGVATITVVEGFIDQVVFEGSLPPTPLLERYAERIRQSRPLNTATLERYLLLMQDLPGVEARALLRPSPQVPGASDVVISLSQKHIDGLANFDNRGTRYLGPEQGGITLNANHLLGLHERTQLRGISTTDAEELAFFQLSHDEQLGSDGTRLTLSATRTRTRPSYRLENFDIDGRDSLFSASVTHPWLRARRSNLFTSAQFDIRSTSSESLGQPLYEDRLRVLRVGATFDAMDALAAVNRLDTQLSKGFGWVDNPDFNTRSRAGGRTDFWKFNASASRLQPLDGAFSLLTAAQIQLSSAALLSAEQFGIGGAGLGSAYDPSELTGDSGVGGRIELQYAPDLAHELLDAAQCYGFYDIGRVYTRNPAAGLKSHTSLASAGAGVRFNILEDWSGSLELARPLTRPVAALRPRHGNDTRAFFSLGYRF